MTPLPDGSVLSNGAVALRGCRDPPGPGLGSREPEGDQRLRCPNVSMLLTDRLLLINHTEQNDYC